MASRRILVVEDEQTLRRIVCEALESAGYDVAQACDGEDGMRCFEERHADLVVADIMMPRMDGFEMVRRMRARHPDTLFLFLSARSGAEDVVEGFRTGGHDYLRKPFAMSELMVRIEALLSRLGSAASELAEYTIGSYTFDVMHSTLHCGQSAIRLSAREVAILRLLAANVGRVVSSRAMLLDLWGDDSYYNLRSLNVFISKLRNYLMDDARIEIVSVRGVGYRLVVAEE
ncbi:MAG: response regulator transcription factor [Alistipes sp.]|nr:response regulator transcription factor [Alistipes sp.]